MLSAFFPQVLYKLYSEVLDFWVFSSLSILECFLNWDFKRAIVPECIYFQINQGWLDIA